MYKHSIPVELYTEVLIGYDDFNREIYKPVVEVVEHCLVKPTLTEDVISSINLDGTKEQYTIAIPKGDAHEWKNKKVSFVLCGVKITCKTYGPVLRGIESLVPMEWHGQIRCERYE